MHIAKLSMWLHEAGHIDIQAVNPRQQTRHQPHRPTQTTQPRMSDTNIERLTVAQSNIIAQENHPDPQWAEEFSSWIATLPNDDQLSFDELWR